MKKIKILKGGYGLADKSGRVSLKTKDDEPFDAPDKDADMLVEGGFAEFVGKQRKKTKSETPKEDPEETEETIEAETESESTETDLNSLTLDELHKMADDLDITYKARDKKDALIKLIEEAMPPSFDPQEVEG